MTVPPSAPSSLVNSMGDSTVLEMDAPFRRNNDEDMEELGSGIDFSMWIDSTATAGSTSEFDAFFSSPVSTPATSQKTPGPMSPSFPTIDDSVVRYDYYEIWQHSNFIVKGDPFYK